MDYDYIQAVEKRFNNIYSLGGETERSFWQNVGKIVNKKSVYESNDNAFDKIQKTALKIMNNEYTGEKNDRSRI